MMYNYEIRTQRQADWGAIPGDAAYGRPTAPAPSPNGNIELIQAATVRPIIAEHGPSGFEALDDNGDVVAIYFSTPRSVRRLGPVEENTEGNENV